MRYPVNIEPFEEGIVQFIARHGYQQLLHAIGASPLHQGKIIANGLTYPIVTSNLIYLLNKAGIEADDLFNIIKTNGWQYQLKQRIAESLAISFKKTGYLFNQSETKTISDFKARVDMQIKNAQNNTGAS